MIFWTGARKKISVEQSTLKLRFSANICFKNIKFSRGTYFLRQKHFIVEIETSNSSS